MFGSKTITTYGIDMASCESALRKFVKQIEPTATQKHGAQRSHNFLRDVLCTGKFASRIKTSYLSGSYARDTAIAPLDDVDIIFVVNPKAWPRALLMSRPSPDKILESFARAVRHRYPKSSVRVQRRSICLQLYHLNIDVVPAVEVDDTEKFILIPDADTGNWIKSAPKLHSAKATEINKRHGGRFKPLVKLLKYWNSNLPKTARFKSFAIETLAARLFHSVDLLSLENGLALFFDFLASLDGNAQLRPWPDSYGVKLNWWATEVLDLAGTGSNLVANVDDKRRRKFLEHATRSRDRMVEATATTRADTACLRISKALRIPRN